MNEPCPPHLDADGQSLWKMCRFIIDGGTMPVGTSLTLQALWLCRELRAESDATARERARCVAMYGRSSM